MINSIPTIESGNAKVFGEITKKNSPKYYWLQDVKYDSVNIQKDKNNLSGIFMTPDKARKTNNTALLGLSIAGATVLTAGTLVFLLKGGPKGLVKNFRKVRDYLEDKIQKSKLNNMSDTKINRAYIFMVHKIDSLLQKVEAVNNFTSVKDLTFKKIMSATPFLRKIHDNITQMFEKIGRQSVVNSYNETYSTLGLAQAVSKGVRAHVLSGSSESVMKVGNQKLTKAQVAVMLDGLDDDLIQIYNKYFNVNARSSRYLKIKKYAQYLKGHFHKLSSFWSKDIVNSFMAESAIAKEKLGIQKTVRGFRKEFSYSLADLSRDSDKKIIQMTRMVSHKDIEKINMLRNLRNDIKMIARTGVLNNKVKTDIIAQLNKFKAEITKSLDKKNIDIKAADEMFENIDELVSSITDFKQGKVEDILDVYKNILTPKEFSEVRKAYRKSVKSLDASIGIETEDFINKVRDLSLGSAPTDILTIIGSLATLGYHLGKSESNEQRTSISLKYGIPAIAGIGTALYCNAKLFSGSKMMIIGATSTMLVNKLGSMADEYLKKHRQKRTNNL
ncbi:hypothetical protein HDR58_07325 [bacterium]|nr:hypothetical protein [bacterium]